MYIPTETGLKKRETITELVEAYNETCRLVKEAFTSFSMAVECFKRVGRYFPNIEIKSTYRALDDRDISEATQEITSKAWEGIIDKTQMREAMTEKRWKEIENQIETKKMPNFTVDNVLAILTSLYGRTGELLNESIIEVFETLRPRHSRHKTNSEEEIPAKVILTYMVDSWGINHYYEQRLVAVDNVFSLLDGKGISKYPGTLLVAIKTAMSKNETTCETEYFKVKWFRQARTLHLQFKRLDLLARLNQIAGGNRLKKPQGEES